MAKDPAFLFYPGDYLRDTQCLSEHSQVAYDRIMCEHMRNICITQEQLNFFTKRLNEDEKKELLFTLTKVKGGFHIGWVYESICKRRTYSESRSHNRKGKIKEDMKTYDSHMEIAIVNEDLIKKEIDTEKDILVFHTIEQCLQIAIYDDRWVRANKTSDKELHEFNLLLERRGVYEKNPLDYKTHFANWKHSGKKEESLNIKPIGTNKAAEAKARAIINGN